MSSTAPADDKHLPSDNSSKENRQQSIQSVNPQNLFGQPHPAEDEDDRDDYDDYDFQMNG
jgi:hypothetical protein